MRVAIAVMILIGCGVGVAAFFWQQNLKYSLPTPVPADYKVVNKGESISLPGLSDRQAYFLHFYNPDCPCSRFNARHIKSLVRSYKDSINIVVIVESEKDIQKAQAELGENLTIRVDKDQLIAKACGVYSTPQAAIIDKGGKLYYRGNYNQSRYCTVRATNFAELSLIALLNHQPPPAFGLLSSQSYGCELGKANNGFDLSF